MIPIYHLTTPEAWQAARDEPEFRVSSLDAEGFIHASTAAQDKSPFMASTTSAASPAPLPRTVASA